MSTVYRLFDLDFDIFVISDAVMELPVDHHTASSSFFLDILLPKMGLTAVTLEEALAMLDHGLICDP